MFAKLKSLKNYIIFGKEQDIELLEAKCFKT